MTPGDDVCRRGSECGYRPLAGESRALSRRTVDDSWDIATSVGVTAVMVALARAAETASAEPLIRDPFAEALVSTPELAEVRQQVASWWADRPDVDDDIDFTADAQQIINYQAVRTHFFDAYFTAAAEAGIRQVVILAAGLDSRAYRLAWPDGTVIYEIDLPKVLQYKTETLAKHGAEPSTTRRTVPVDLRHDWPKALREAGFNETRPTAWLAEGLLPFLPAQAQEAMFASIDELSGAGSQVAVEVFGIDEEQRKQLDEKWARLQEAREKRGQGVPFSPLELWFDDGGRPDSAEWFAAHGWTTQTIESREESTRVGRAPTSDDPRLANKFVVAGRT
jgi:methyltransferase (TIGR00027 family)